MLNQFLHVCMGLCICITIYAQQSFSINGSVMDANTSKPISGASILGNERFTTSSASGTFILKEMTEGTYEMTISCVGYTTKRITVIAKRQMQPIEVQLQPSTTRLEAVEVVGESQNMLIEEAPIVSRIVSESFLNENRENSLMQTLSKIPGVSTINIGSGQSKPVIRGLGFNRVSVVQNGIKHEAQQWGNDHGLEIDQYGIENIQIVKGPASLVYGSDAIAGVVDIQPNKTPTQNFFGGELNLLGESNNNLLGVSTGIEARKEKWFYRGRFTYRDYGDYKVPTDIINYENYIFELHDKHLRNTAGREANASLTVGYVSGNIKSETFLSNVYAKNGFFANAHGLEVRSSSIDYDGSSRDIDLPFHQVNHFKVMNNTSIYMDKHAFHFDLGYQTNHREEHSEPVPHGYMPKPESTKERVFNKDTYTLNMREVFNPNDQHDLVAGINMEYQDNNIGGWGFLIPAYDRFTIGAFAYDQFQVRSDLHFLLGLRYDYGVVDTKHYQDWYPSIVNGNDGTTSSDYLQRAQDKTLRFGNVSASAGVSYLLHNTSFKLNVGKSFRMPLANELASYGVNYHMYRYERGNLDLDPEESYQLDLEINQKQQNFSLGFSPFINFFENFIYLNPTPRYYETLQIYEYTQAEVFRYGGELKASTTLLKSLQLDASAEYVLSRQTSGAKEGFTLPFAPPLSALFSASYQFKQLLFFDKPRFIVDYRATENQDEIVPPEEKTAGYQVLNASFLANIQMFKSEQPVQLRLKLNNVFNTRYFNHTSFYRLIDVPEAGRNFSITLNIPF